MSEKIEIHSPEEGLSFSVGVFDGPLELLLTLVTKQKINIYDIPIAKILDQYMQYLEYMHRNDAEISSEFIVMACELLYIKSKMLLPKEEQEEDPRSELVMSLIAYSKVKETGDFLAQRGERYFNRYYPTPAPFDVKIETAQMDVRELVEAYIGLKLSLKEDREKRKEESVKQVFSRKVIPIEDKIITILKRLIRSLDFGNSVMFNTFFDGNHDVGESVATFLAMLELVNSGRISFLRDGDNYIISLNRSKTEEKEIRQ